MTSKPLYSSQTLSAAEALSSLELITEWKRLLHSRPHVNALFASPDWIAHLETLTAGEVQIIILRDPKGTMAGVASLRRTQYRFQFAIGSRVLYQRRLPVADLLGSQLLVADAPGCAAAMWSAILKAANHERAVYLDALDMNSQDAQSLWNRQQAPDGAYAYLVDGPRPWRLAALQCSFEDYLGQMSGKSRSTLRRKHRQLADFAGGHLEFQAVMDAETVPQFLHDANIVSRRSWQHRVLGPRISDDERGRLALIDLANRGLLRSYLLKAGELPCAFVVGYQYEDVYHYAELGFDEGFKDYSPGTILLYLILEDLHRKQRPRTFNFGVGDASYKIRFANIEQQDATCLILHRTTANRLLTANHHVFTRFVGLAKRMIGRKVTK